MIFLTLIFFYTFFTFLNFAICNILDTFGFFEYYGEKCSTFSMKKNSTINITVTHYQLCMNEIIVNLK